LRWIFRIILKIIIFRTLIIILGIPRIFITQIIIIFYINTLNYNENYNIYNTNNNNFDMNTLNYKKNNNIYNTNNYIKKPKNIYNTNYNIFDMNALN